MAGKTEYKNNWQKENVDRVNLTMAKGRKDTVKVAAAAVGESVNSYINVAITQRMERDGAGGPQEPARLGVVSLPSETVKAAQEAAEAAGETAEQFISRAVETQAQRDKVARGLKR